MDANNTEYLLLTCFYRWFNAGVSNTIVKKKVRTPKNSSMYRTAIFISLTSILLLSKDGHEQQKLSKAASQPVKQTYCYHQADHSNVLDNSAIASMPRRN